MTRHLIAPIPGVALTVPTGTNDVYDTMSVLNKTHMSAAAPTTHRSVMPTLPKGSSRAGKAVKAGGTAGMTTFVVPPTTPGTAHSVLGGYLNTDPYSNPPFDPMKPDNSASVLSTPSPHVGTETGGTYAKDAENFLANHLKVAPTGVSTMAPTPAPGIPVPGTTTL